MTPREKWRIALISVVVISLAVLCLALYFIPTFLYILFILGVSCVACFYHTNDQPSHSREGHNPRPNLIFPPLFRRWLPGKTANGVPSAGRAHSRGNRGRFIKGDPKESVGLSSERRLESPGLFRKDTEFSGSLLFSPRDILMGSYLGKPDSPSAVGKLGGAETRELRERLSRPNHAVHTPNRRLSFGEPLGAAGRFTITPQRHYPIQQTGCSPLGVLAPTQWHGYTKKNVLTPRNCHGIHSPVTVKIARPDHGSSRSPFLNHLSSPLTSLTPGLASGSGLGAAADPCSRETVLSVLKESRKRGAEEEEDRSYIDANKTKRRRHDSSESSQSAFEPLLANGNPSQLVPKPGRIKRGMNTLLVDESVIKRSRTSSVSSLVSGVTPGGVPGSARNPIFSSYSSSQGTVQKKASTLSLSPISSPGSSRSQTPERPSKKPREEVAHSSNAVPTSKIDTQVAGPSATAGKSTPANTAPLVTSPTGSGGSEGKRKRKIPLVPSRRGEHISLPPPPELGYTVTVTDLDLEKKAALDRIKKALEEPEPVQPVLPEDPASGSAPTATGSLLLGSVTSTSSCIAPISTVATSMPGSDAAAADSTSTAPAPSNNSSIPVAAASAPPISELSNPLLESLKKMKDSPVPSPSPATTVAAPTADVVPGAVMGTSASAPSVLGTGAVKLEPSSTPAQPSLTLVQSSLTSAQSSLTPLQPSLTPAQPSLTLAQSTSATTIQLPSSVSTSAFSQILPQPTQSSAPGQAVTFSLSSVTKPAASSSSSTPTPAVTTDVANNNPLASAFKPIFGVGAPGASTASTSVPTSTPAAPAFKPIFGSVTTATGGGAFGQPQSTTSTTSVAPPTSESGSVFGRLSDPPAQTQTPAKSLFGSWSTASSASTTATTNSAAGTNGGSFQFGTTPASTSAPALNSTSSTNPAPFQFGATATTTVAAQTTTTQASFTFGGFSMTPTPSSTSAAPVPAASQPAFTFGKPSFDAPTAFPGAPQSQPGPAKPFAFGSGGVSGTGTTPFSFGGATTATTTAPVPAFGTPSAPAFGGTTSGFTFGGSTAPSAAPTFGSTTQSSAPAPTPAPTFSFGATPAPQASAPAPTQPSTGGFNFGATVPGTQFGTPTPANPSFSFGQSKDSKPAFGTSTPAFGQNTGAPIPFGSPNFNAMTPFGASPTPSFSIGSGSKPSGSRQRLQARRQHPRKK
ncbi:hypothetical protein AGOR_G00126380 [Albula goreensis]|uniref:Uncharacterized protein n=1 Tax=Albula goreensis TaxID=1534307 RepID=A0A8T3D823_9TELE|nr:hypothetical protein AGOR_G00126380 [Albula goreensis]